jgi:hypothetical protein
MDMSDPRLILTRALEFHGHRCWASVAGVQFATGCTLGKGNMSKQPLGKLAVTLVEKKTHRALRGLPRTHGTGLSARGGRQACLHSLLGLRTGGQAELVVPMSPSARPHRNWRLGRQNPFTPGHVDCVEWSVAENGLTRRAARFPLARSRCPVPRRRRCSGT